MIRCWPAFKTVNKPAAAHIRHARRIGRAVKRAGGVAASKPAIIGWTCIAVALIPPLFTVPAALPAVMSNGSTGPVDVSPWLGIDTLPPVNEWPVIGPPVLLPDVPLVPEVPTTPPTRIPEPGSAALLVTALVGMRAAYRVIKVRSDGIKLPRCGPVLSQFRARRTARLLAVTNTDPSIDHYAVSDGKRIVFRTPDPRAWL